MEKKSYNSVSKYWVELILIFLHLLGPLSIIGVIIGSAYTFICVAFFRRIDLLRIFLLFVPHIVLRSSLDSENSSDSVSSGIQWLKIYMPTLENVMILGPIAVSTIFFASIGGLVRLVRTIFLKRILGLYLVWLISLFLALAGLFLAFFTGAKSSGGLTVGFRIVLSIGCLLFPLAINEAHLRSQLIDIIKISLILFLLGFLNSHWIFVAAAFPATLFFISRSDLWRSVSVLVSLIMLGFAFTFTIKLTVLSSWLITFFFGYLKLVRLKTYSVILILLFPFLIMLFVLYKVQGNPANVVDITNSFTSKLYDDRGTIWLFTVALLLNSPIFIVPAGRDIPVIDFLGVGEGNWGAGAHNIYLEMARQLGLFTTFLLIIIIAKKFMALRNYKLNSVTYACFISGLLSVFMVYGLTGNSLIYDGVGFLYWLILGQMIHLSNQYN